MRLIDADKIKLPQGFFEKVNNVPKFYEWLDKQPTVDAVEVRCKDCRWYAGEGMYCTNNILTQFDHFFCYYGERKEDKK